MAIAESIDLRTGERDRHAGWRLLWWAVRSQGYGVPAGIAGGVVWMLAAASAPTVLSRAIDQGLVTGDRSRLTLWIAALIGLGVIEAGAWAVRHRFAVRNGQGTAAAVRERLLHHLHRLDASFYDRWPTGEILSRCFSDATWVGMFVDILAHTSGYVAAVAAVAVLLTLIDPLLALVTLLPLAPISVAAWRYSARYRQRSHALQEELAQGAIIAEDTIGGIRTLKGLRAEDAQRTRYGRQSELIRARGLEVARLDAIFQPVMDALPTLGLLVVVWLGSYFAISGRISVGELVAFYAYIVLLATPLRVLGIRIGTVQRSLAAAERISELLSIRPKVVEPSEPLPSPLPIPDTHHAARCASRGCGSHTEWMGRPSSMAWTYACPPDPRWLSSVRRGPENPHSRVCWSGIMMWPRAGCRSTAWTCESCHSSSCAGRWWSYRSSRSYLRTRCTPTSPSDDRTRIRERSSAPPGWPEPTSSLQSSPTDTTRWLRSGAARSPGGSVSGS